MKNIKYIFISVLIFLMLTSCGNNNNDMSNTASPSPDTTQNGTDNGNVIDDAGNAVEDVGRGVANGVKDVGDGVADGIDAVTGNENNNAH